MKGKDESGIPKVVTPAEALEDSPSRALGSEALIQNKTSEIS